MASQERPPVWIGHVSLASTEVKQTTDCLISLGLRSVHREDQFAVLELRGGTHLVVHSSDDRPAAGAQASFDLMYEDIDATRLRCQELGLRPSEISEGRIHRSFTIVEPGGHLITINSSHVGQLPV